MPVASVVMSTRDRRDELRRAIASCLTQSVPVEVVVRDDGSSDGTEDMVRAEFPWVDYLRHPGHVGSIVNRNLGVRAARTNVIISLDDDAAFASPSTVEVTLAELDHPRVGAVAIPYIDVGQGRQVVQRAPDEEDIYAIAYFRGCAAAWRRDVFLSVGGYHEILFHMAEEPDYSMRMLDLGYITRLGTADPVFHFESPTRDPQRVVSLIVRNGVLMGVLNAPGLMMPIHALGSAVRSLVNSVPRGQVSQTVTGLCGAVAALPSALRQRHPLRRGAHSLYRDLLTRGPLKLDSLLDRLPAGGGQGPS